MSLLNERTSQTSAQNYSRPSKRSRAGMQRAFHHSAASAGVLLLTPVVLAQIPAASSNETKEILSLSPFEVSANTDVGFVATSSLAGGRLAGNLKDTPAAYSVLTREFIDAIGIVDLSSASQWTVNSTQATTDGSDEVFGRTTQINARGVSASSSQRNFFDLGVNFDSYNLDRFDYSRGPNSILFGSGTFGGAANVVTKVARTDKTFGTLRLVYGSWNDRRATLDVNQPLGDKGAIRINALAQNADGWRDFQEEFKRAITAAGLWRPFRNSEVRVESEVGRFHRNNPVTTMIDRFLGWDGVTTFSAPLLSTPGNANAAGIQRIGSSTAPYYVWAPALGMATIGNLANTARTIGAGQAAGTRIGGMVIEGPSANYAGNQFTEAVNAPTGRFDLALANSKFFLPERSFSLSTNEPTLKQNYDTHSLFVRQKIGENLFTEVAGNYTQEDKRTQYLNARNLTAVYLDINRNLPNGAPNPMFLEPYSDGQRSRGWFDNEIANVRAAAAYTYDADKWGRYVINAYGGASRAVSNFRVATLRILRDADSRNWAFNDTVFYRYYLRERDRPLPDLTTADYIDPASGLRTTFPAGWINDGTRPTDVSETTTEQRYLQAAIKGALFKDRLHLLGAVRNDHLELSRKLNKNYGDYPQGWNGTAHFFRPEAPADYLNLSYTPKNAAGQVIGQPKLADIRPRDNNRIPLAQYASDRFQDDFNPPATIAKETTFSTGAVYHVFPWMSAYANHARGFAPASGNVFLDGTFLPSARSKGTDAGLRFYLLDQRVVASVGYYRGFESPQSVELSGSQNTFLNTIAQANVVGDTSIEGRNIRNFNNVPTQTYDTRDRSNEGIEIEMTANLRSNWRLSFNAAVPVAYQENAFSNTRAFLDTNESVMKQILADAGVLVNASNVASVDASIPINDRSPDANAAANAWNSLQTFKAGLVTGRQKITRLNELTANIFTDYRFEKGWLKNASIGAGANYRGREVIGYRGADVIPNPANPAQTIDAPNVDAYTPVYQDGYFLVTGTLGYVYKLSKSRSLQLQLRVSNLLNEDQPRYYSTVQRPINGDVSQVGRVATANGFYYLTPRNYSFSMTLNF